MICVCFGPAGLTSIFNDWNDSTSSKSCRIVLMSSPEPSQSRSWIINSGMPTLANSRKNRIILARSERSAGGTSTRAASREGRFGRQEAIAFAFGSSTGHIKSAAVDAPLDKPDEAAPVPE